MVPQPLALHDVFGDLATCPSHAGDACRARRSVMSSPGREAFLKRPPPRRLTSVSGRSHAPRRYGMPSCASIGASDAVRTGAGAEAPLQDRPLVRSDYCRSSTPSTGATTPTYAEDNVFDIRQVRMRMAGGIRRTTGQFIAIMGRSMNLCVLGLGYAGTNSAGSTVQPRQCT